jgi:phage shock protein A
MFDELRAAFKEALDNFNKELSRSNVSDTADKLLVGMRNEIVSEKAAVAGVEDHLTKTRGQIDRLKGEAATARRREEMARSIGDEETVRLAVEFATKAEQHIAVLEKKAAALAEEHGFRQRTVEEMYARFNEAKEKRDALSATTGRTGARESISAADDLFDELDRMADKIDDNKARGEAAQAFDELDLSGQSEFRVDLDEPPPSRELDVDSALEELKRRMKESD